MVSHSTDRDRMEAHLAELVAELDRARAEAESLRTTVTTLQAILELTSASVFAKDVEGRYLVVNPRGAEIVGRTPDEILGRTDHEIYDPVSAGRFRAHDLEVMASGEAVTTQMPVPTPQGDATYLSIVAPLVDADGAIFGTAGIASDVTERVRSEELLRERTHELLTAQRIARLGGWTWNPTTDEIHLDPELRRLLGGSDDDEWDITRLVSITHGPDRRLVVEALQEAARGRPADLVFRIHDPVDGSDRWLHLRTETREDVSLVVGTVQDVTERELAERDRLELERRLQQTQRLESVGRLAGGVAHDVNNLLAVLRIESELARAVLTPDHPADAHLVAVQSTLDRAAAVARQFLVFSRHEPHDIGPVDIAALVEDLVTLLRRSLGADIELISDVPNWLPAVHAERTQLEQAIVNLAVNARDAMPAGGRLEVRGRLSTDPSRSSLDRIEGTPSLSTGPAVVIEVTDTGPGMTPEVRDRAFEPFFTTKPSGTSTGLGLATVYSTVRRWGGQVDLDTAEGRGTTVRLVLPVSGRPAETRTDRDATPAPAELIPTPGDDVRTVLVVEDQSALRRLAATVLERAGYRTILAADGEAALEAAAAAPELDVVVTDVVMPKMSGGDLARRLRELRPELPVVFMSGYSAGMLEGQLPDDDEVHLLDKPFTGSDLVAAVARALGGPG